jgi:parallel beta-helix repeat protein
MKQIAAAVAALLILALPACAKKESFTISRDTLLQSNFVVPESVTCTIKPGTTVQFSGYYKFVVHGLLIARGTANEPITFTCAGRSHGAVASPCWYGIVIMGKEAGAYLRNCRFEGMYQCLVWESSPVFDSCEFVGNHYALYCTKKASPHLKNCRFYRNVYGVVADFGMPVLVDNVITDNTIGVCLEIGSQPIAGPNTIFGNKTNIRSETALKGDTAGFSIQGLWELMNELY